MAKALSAKADAVILDLEDAVPDPEKERARELVADVIAGRVGHDGAALFVRLNAPGDERCAADIAAVVRPGLAGVRLPKCEDTGDVVAAVERIGAAERAQGLPEGSIAVVCGIESARGLSNAMLIATANPRVLALAFGAADFARDLHLESTPQRTETLYARSQLVIISRVAGIRPPIESVHTDIGDTAGLDRTTREARSLGFFGRSVIHPAQVATVNAVFTPDLAEIERARTIIEAARSASTAGAGALRMANGEFVDTAIVRRAEDTLRLATDLSEARP